jgi:AcrR family transcriptional regulator
MLQTLSVKSRRTNPEARPGELVAAARDLFTRGGFAATTVSDIARAAGVAKGTFYLYFESKEDIIDAVAEEIAGEMVSALEVAVGAVETGAVDKLLALGSTMVAFAGDETAWDLAEAYHRPENRVVHDRMAVQMMDRLVPLVESVVKDGVEEGQFAVENPRRAAFFILGGLRALESASDERADLPDALREGIDAALHVLGYKGVDDEASRSKQTPRLGGA